MFCSVRGAQCVTTIYWKYDSPCAGQKKAAEVIWMSTMYIGANMRLWCCAQALLASEFQNSEPLRYLVTTHTHTNTYFSIQIGSLYIFISLQLRQISIFHCWRSISVLILLLVIQWQNPLRRFSDRFGVSALVRGTYANLCVCYVRGHYEL